MDRPKIFISYGREPVVNNFVEKLERDLIEDFDFQIWRDVYSIPLGNVTSLCQATVATHDLLMYLGDTFHNDIARGISECDIFLAFITGRFLDSKYCPKELFQANEEGKKIIPIIFENVDYAQYKNGPGVKLVIGSINQFRFSNGPNEDYQELLSKLRTAIEGSDDTDSGIPIVIQPTPQYIPPGPDVNVEQLRKEVKAVIQRNYCKITDLDDENLEPIAGELSSVDLISRPIRRRPSYKSIVNEIESILDCNRTVEELQDTCKKFLKAFKKVEGAASNVATTLEKEWNVAIKKKFYFDFIVSQMV